MALGSLLAAWAMPAAAEDIDVFASNTARVPPNVLFLLDNTSNWSANSQGWSKTDALNRCGSDAPCIAGTEAIFGTASSLVQGQIEVRSLKRVIQELVCTSDAKKKLEVNVGIMMLSPSKGSVTGEASWVGGWLLKAIGPATTENCAATLAKLDEIDANLTKPDYKAAADASYGGAMFEVFKYFGGHTNPLGRATGASGSPVGPAAFGPQRYTAPYALEDVQAFTDSGKSTYRNALGNDLACSFNAKNYLVVVGNTFPNSEVTTNSPLYDRQLKALGYNIGQVEAHKFVRYADEWAKFLVETDLSPAEGVQNITTYTVNVYNTTANADQTALLRSMARVGGAGEAGGYFEVSGNVGGLINAFSDIVTSISAVNSVFASASLPVSVNTQGTFLNQVFMGMFRPDPDARPRWNGNLKQYQFALTASGELFLADRDGRAALNHANTGFIDRCRSSFWTRDSGTYWAGVPAEQTPYGACASTTFAPTSDEPDGEIVEKGAAAQRLRDTAPSSRTLRTCTNLACTLLAEFNSTTVNELAAALGLTTVSEDLVRWLRGENVGDGPRTSDGRWQHYGFPTTAARPTIHGDVVHARPLTINYGSGNANDVVAYYGSGDGWLRALDGNQSGSNAGRELWGFFAPEFLRRANRLRENTQLVAFPSVTAADKAPKDYFFDGNIGAYQESRNGRISRLFLYPAMRRGGRQIYAFDATQRPTPGVPSTLPSIKWRFGCPSAVTNNDQGCSADAALIGQTWSTPRPVRIKGDSTVYLVFGGGYDVCEDTDSCGAVTKGQGLFVLNADSGALLAHIPFASLHPDAGRVIADVVPVDVNSDGFTDVIYAVDTRGNVWRTNVSDRDAASPFTGYPVSLWAGRTYRIAKVANWTETSGWTQRRKFQYAPDVMVLGDTAHLLIGTGDREQPLMGSNATKVRNRFYALRDDLLLGGRSGNSSMPVLIDDSSDCDAGGNSTLSPGCQLLNVTALGLDYEPTLRAAGTRGWVMDLGAAQEPFEQVVTTPVTLAGVTYFSTFQPRHSSNACEINIGTSRGYAVRVLNGGVRPGDLQRAMEFQGGGFAPSPVAGIVMINGQKVPFVIGTRRSVRSSALGVARVTAPVEARRKKVYRYETIDN